MVNYCVDTNAVIALIRNDPSIAVKTATEQLFIPIVVLGELYFGAEKSTRVGENIARLDNFAAKTVILTADNPIAREYGKVHNELRLKGRPIPTNDIWIAATARCHDLTLLTRDGHFGNADRLRFESW